MRTTGIVLTLAAGLLFLTAGRAAAQQFQDQTSTRFPPSPNEYCNQFSIADIDGDGDLDIVWAEGQGYSSAGAPLMARIYINDGTGHFTDQSVARGAPTGWFRGVEFGDVDGDGDLDMILAQDFNHQPLLLINDGTGHFTDETSTRLPAITLSCSRAQFADVNNDGYLDLYLVNGGSSRFGTAQGKLYLNDGTGHFTDATAARMPNQTVGAPMDCIFGDIDGNFSLDLRIASRGAGSKLYKNNGLGFFTDVSSQCPTDGTCYSYDFGDIDGDGDLDMIGVNAFPGSSAEFLLQNNGAGVFTNVSSNLMPNPNIDDNDSKFFDYDNDGDLDLIIGSLGPYERIFNNNGHGVFTEVTGLITQIADSTLDIKVADLNGDGKLDIVTAQGESGSFVNRIYMNITGPADTIPPRIVSTEQLADTAATGPFVIRAAILDGMSSDRNFFDKGITLKYSVNGGFVQQTKMKYSGGQIYRGVIPTIPCGGTVTYFVEARDFANNLGTGTSKMFTVSPIAPNTPGDLDGDGDVDGDDAVILAAVLIGADTDPGHVCRADVNADLLLNGLDVQAFVHLLPP